MEAKFSKAVTSVTRVSDFTLSVQGLILLQGDSPLGRIAVQSGFVLSEGSALRWSEAA